MRDYRNKCDCLKCEYKTHIFDFLNDDELTLINQNRFETSFNPGENIFKQGSQMTHMMSIRHGVAKVVIDGIGGRSLIIRLVFGGDFVGGPGMYTDYKHHFNVVAVEPLDACFIDVELMKNLMMKNPRFAMEAHKNANEHNAFTLQRFLNLTQKQMPGRIADALLYLSKEIYKTNPMRIGLSRQDLADMTALSKESVIRNLKSFSEDNIISVKNNNINILDFDELETLSRLG